MRKVKEIKDEIKGLTEDYQLIYNPRVRKLIEEIKKENAPRVAELQAELLEAELAKPEKKPRWPYDTPEDVLGICREYWRGTYQYKDFRIHCWDDENIWTSYPSGGYTDNGGFNPCPAGFYMISKEKTSPSNRNGRTDTIQMLFGRVSLKLMKENLNLAKEGKPLKTNIKPEKELSPEQFYGHEDSFKGFKI